MNYQSLSLNTKNHQHSNEPSDSVQLDDHALNVKTSDNETEKPLEELNQASDLINSIQDSNKQNDALNQSSDLKVTEKEQEKAPEAIEFCTLDSSVPLETLNQILDSKEIDNQIDKSLEIPIKTEIITETKDQDLSELIDSVQQERKIVNSITNERKTEKGFFSSCFPLTLLQKPLDELNQCIRGHDSDKHLEDLGQTSDIKAADKNLEKLFEELSQANCLCIKGNDSNKNLEDLDKVTNQRAAAEIVVNLIETLELTEKSRKTIDDVKETSETSTNDPNSNLKNVNQNTNQQLKEIGLNETLNLGIKSNDSAANQIDQASEQNETSSENILTPTIIGSNELSDVSKLKDQISNIITNDTIKHLETNMVSNTIDQETIKSLDTINIMNKASEDNNNIDQISNKSPILNSGGPIYSSSRPLQKPKSATFASEKPIIVQPLKNSEFLKGTLVLLECKIQGSNLLIEWYKDRNRLHSQEKRYKMTYDEASGMARLFIPTHLEGDAGEYSCHASNKFGNAVTTARLIAIGSFFYHH